MLIVAFAAAVVARYYALEPVQIMDSSMTPKFKERSIVWVCKLPQCVSNVEDLDNVLVRVHNDEVMFRRVLAIPGDSISISDKGKVITPHRNFKWKGEDAFIQSRSIYVPKAGDTLYFNQLNDVEQDYLISYLRHKGENVLVKTTLWQGDREINLDRVGATKIANRQVSLKEINFLPWQDRNLIEMQIRLSEPGNSPIKLKRALYLVKKDEPKPPLDTLPQLDPIPQDSTTQDSLQPPPKPAPRDTTVERPIEEIATPINQVIIDKDCYFLACEKGSNCPDSRELGYFTQDRIVGWHLKKTDEFKKKFVDPTLTYVRFGVEVIRDIWHNITDVAESTVDYVRDIIP